MKLTPLFLFAASCFFTGCDANQAHYNRPNTVWEWHDLWKAGNITDDKNGNVVGFVDDNGTIYDPLRNRLGRIETIGTIKKNKMVVGFVRNNLDVYNAQHEWVGNVDQKGYILDRNEQLSGTLHEDDFTSSTINFSKRPVYQTHKTAQHGRLDFSDDVYDSNEKKVGIITYVPEETDYQAIPIAHPADRMITASRFYGALLLIDYDKAVTQHKAERAQYAYLCRYAYSAHKGGIYNKLNQLIGYMDKRDGFNDRNVYDLKRHRIGFISYGGTDLANTAIIIYDDSDRAVGRVPYGFEESGARMLLDGINNMHVPWDGFEKCDGGSLDENHNLYDAGKNRIGRIDQKLYVRDLQDKIVGQIGANGLLFDENKNLITQPAGNNSNTLESYKGTLSQFEEAYNIIKTYQDRRRGTED